MNWLKAKRLIRRKPYLLDPYRCRSAEEAQKILDEEGVLSPDALLSAARVRAGMSEACLLYTSPSPRDSYWSCVGSCSI